MLKILTYNEINREHWSRLVRESRTGTWFQSLEAYELYASLPDIFHPIAIGISNTESRNSDCELRGVCVGYVTREKGVVRQYFTRRAIIIGGPLIADDATNEEVETLMKAIRNQFDMHEPGSKCFESPIYIETRNFNDYSRWRNVFEAIGFTYKPHLNYHVDCRDNEMMRERLSNNRKRQINTALTTADTVVLTNKQQNTAIAINENVQNDIVSEEMALRFIHEWYGILARLYRTKVKTPLFPLSFFLEFYKKGYGIFLMVVYKGTVIGGMMCPILDERYIYEWFVCGEDVTYKKQYPSVMVTYAAMDYASKHGIQVFDIMGAGEPGVPYGVRDFKSAFGGKLVEYGRFLCVCHPFLYRIGKIGVKLLKMF